MPAALAQLASRLPTSRYRTARAAYARAGLATDNAALARLVLAGAQHRWRYSVRAAALCSRRQRRALHRGVKAAGGEHLDAALAGGRGVVLASVHMSDFDFGGSWLAQARGHEVVAVVGGSCAHAREAAFDRVRRACGVIVRREEQTGVADLVEDLARGRIVTVMLDRRPRAGGIELDFFGHRALVPMAPFLLARRAGAPVLVGGIRMRDDGGHLVRFAPALPLLDNDGRAWLQSVIHQLEALIRAAPEQWHIPPAIAQLPWHPRT
jgi:KDO2-lipid IV(A) lauroyltransferase